MVSADLWWWNAITVGNGKKGSRDHQQVRKQSQKKKKKKKNDRHSSCVLYIRYSPHHCGLRVHLHIVSRCCLNPLQIIRLNLFSHEFLKLPISVRQQMGRPTLQNDHLPTILSDGRVSVKWKEQRHRKHERVC
jgi:hypothetical protein